MQHRLFLLLVTVFLLSLALMGCTAEESGAEPATFLERCHLTATIAARCGTISVPENWDRADGPLISLNVAVLPARDRLSELDPLFFLPGGPGQAAVETFPLVARTFFQINRDRDIVLVDQRGTGESNPLRCPALDDQGDLVQPSAEELEREARRCVQALDADLSAYTTAASAHDLEAVRRALGYEEINLYGASYGTRLAQVYMRRYPDRVRTAILDGVVPLNYQIFLNTPQDAQRALELLFARCAADPACDSRFPQLQMRFEQVLEQLGDEPILVALADPVTGASEEIQLDRATFTTLIFNLTYSPETVSLLPLLLTDAAKTGDLGRLVAHALLATGDRGLYEGLFYSVVCAEDVPAFTLAQAEAARQQTYFPVMARTMLAVCEQWPAAAEEAAAGLLPELQIPVLLLSGEADPVTPPANAERAAAYLPNSRHLVAPSLGHNVAPRGCLPQVMAEFVATADLEALDTACVQNIESPPFFIDFLGPE